MHARSTTFVSSLVRQRIGAICAALLGLACWVSRGHTAPLEIHPMISGTGRYDSNFYLSEENERGVYSYAVQPGMRLGVETPKTRLKLDYTLEAWFYDEETEPAQGAKEANEDDYIGHILGAEARLTPFTRLTLGLDETFYTTRLPGLADQFSNSISRDRYNVNTLNPLVYYEFENRFGLGAQYRWTDIAYDELSDNDATEHRGIFDLFYNPRRTITLNLDYQFWNFKQDTDLPGAEYDSNQLMLLAQKRFKYFAIDGGIGYQTRDYADSASDDRESLAYRLAITGQNPPPPETMRYLGKEQYLQSKTHLYLALDHNLNNLGILADQYTADRLVFSVGHIFADKFLTRLKGYYQYSDYLEDEFYPRDRKDDIFSLAGRLGYLFNEKLSLNFEAGYQQRDSNIHGYDYENDYYMLSLDFDYDVGSHRKMLEEASFYYR